MIMRVLGFLFFLHFSIVCAAQDDYSVFSIPSDLSDGVDSVLRDEHITVDISDISKLKFTMHRVITIYNKVGLGDADAFVFYDNNTQVNDLEARVYNRMGKEIEKFKKRDFQDVSAVSGGTLYSDSRALYLEYTPTSYPFTMVLDYEYTSKTTAFIPGWLPLGAYDSSTAASTYEIIYNPDIKLNYKETNFEGYDIEKTEEPGHIVYTAKDLKTLESEYLAPAFTTRAPRVRFALEEFYLEGVHGKANDWAAFGSWMNDYLVSESNDLPQATIDAVRDMTKDLPDDEAKARAIYKYLQDKVRYISVQIEIGGWKPMKASEVDRLSYGDCKALTNYTKNLLEAVGIESYYTVLYAGDKKSIDEELVSIQGNHAILALPFGENDYTFLECTSQEVPYGYMGDFTDDRDVFIITPEGGEIVHTTVYDIDDNITKTTVDATLDETGQIKASLVRDSYGVDYGDGLQLTHLDQKELNDNYHHEWDMLTGLLVSDIYIKDDQEKVIFNEALNLEVPKYASDINGDLILRPNMFYYGSKMIPPRYSDRKAHFVIERERQSQKEFNYTLPQGYVLESLPEPVNLKTEFGEYTAKMTQTSPNTFQYTRTLIIRAGVFTPDLYEDYREFWKQIARYDNQKVLLNSKT